jgi:hypothetical protein
MADRNFSQQVVRKNLFIKYVPSAENVPLIMAVDCIFLPPLTEKVRPDYPSLFTCHKSFLSTMDIR